MKSINLKNKNLLIYLILSVTNSLILLLLSRLLLRNLYSFLSFDEQFSAIFSQINNATISSPIIAVSSLVFIIGFLLCKLWKKKTAGKIFAIIIGFLAFIFISLIALLFSFVNNVMFLDVILSLLPLLESGAI